MCVIDSCTLQNGSVVTDNVLFTAFWSFELLHIKSEIVFYMCLKLVLLFTALGIA